MEEYKLIVDYPNYEVSNIGNVRNKTTGRILKATLILNNGYLKVGLSKKKVRKTIDVHKLVSNAFLNNPDDKNCVDHINNNRTDNNVSNLRFATKTENGRNRIMNQNNTSNVKGVSFHKLVKKWRAKITIDGIGVHIGYFENIEDAKQARMKKANEIFGEFVNDCEKLPSIKLKSTVKLFKAIDDLLNKINQLIHL